NGHVSWTVAAVEHSTSASKWLRCVCSVKCAATGILADKLDSPTRGIRICRPGRVRSARRVNGDVVRVQQAAVAACNQIAKNSKRADLSDMDDGIGCLCFLGYLRTCPDITGWCRRNWD